MVVRIGITYVLAIYCIFTRYKQCELLHPNVGDESSNKYSVRPRSIHGEEGSSLS